MKGVENRVVWGG